MVKPAEQGNMMPDIPIERFKYLLPESAIAQEPLAERDRSKLLCYRGGAISHHIFRELPEIIGATSLMVFNDTKVIPARLWFLNQQNVRIEIFLLKELKGAEHGDTYIWECMVGNRRKFKAGDVLTLRSGGVSLEASWYRRDENLVSFRCSGRAAFLEVLETFGHIPLPPYIRRSDHAGDKERYQTVFAKNLGAVAAPTASLHFTEAVLADLKNRGHEQAYLTLHVGAGTFKPVTSEGTAGHEMHTEAFSISKATLRQLQAHQNIIAVGTTTMRVLESLYYVALLLQEGKKEIRVRQYDPYREGLPEWSLPEVVERIMEHMDAAGAELLEGETSIFIIPGMRFRVCKGLVTNFHQPGSTLLMLVEAFIGRNWERVYTNALENGYRMLSYGDASLLFKE